MSDDLLGQATRALREETERETIEQEAGAGVASLTRGRLMASLHERRRHRTARAVMALPLVAVLVAGTAWAAQSGILPSIFRASPDPAEAPPPAESAETPPPRAPRPRAIEAPPVEEPPPPAPVEAPPETPGPTAPPAPSVAPPSRSAPTGALPSASVARAPSEARRLYERAHRAHFETRDPAAALGAWEAYLAAVPSAPKADAAFATEASYNRALCLVRLGRTEAARQALTPFADGRYGSYRQAEARALLDALSGGAAPPP
jgi:outer membrane biosynthesis protein TonB